MYCKLGTKRHVEHFLQWARTAKNHKFQNSQFIKSCKGLGGDFMLYCLCFNQVENPEIICFHARCLCMGTNDSQAQTDCLQLGKLFYHIRYGIYCCWSQSPGLLKSTQGNDKSAHTETKHFVHNHYKLPMMKGVSLSVQCYVREAYRAQI